MKTNVAKSVFYLFMMGAILIGFGIAATSVEFAGLVLSSYVPTSTTVGEYTAITPLELSDDGKIWITGYGVKLKLVEDQSIPQDEIHVGGYYPSDIVKLWNRQSTDGEFLVIASVLDSYKLNVLQDGVMKLSERALQYPDLPNLEIEMVVFVHPSNADDVRIQSNTLTEIWD